MNTQSSKIARALAVAALALGAAGANAATLVIEGGGAGFVAEAWPEGENYQYTFSATPNISLYPAQHNSVAGYCPRRTGSGTVYVTVTYPNGHIESTQRGVSCR